MLKEATALQGLINTGLHRVGLLGRGQGQAETKPSSNDRPGSSNENNNCYFNALFFSKDRLDLKNFVSCTTDSPLLILFSLVID